MGSRIQGFEDSSEYKKNFEFQPGSPPCNAYNSMRISYFCVFPSIFEIPCSDIYPPIFFGGFGSNS
jgi:hypothetical protein